MPLSLILFFAPSTADISYRVGHQASVWLHEMLIWKQMSPYSINWNSAQAYQGSQEYELQIFVL